MAVSDLPNQNAVQRNARRKIDAQGRNERVDDSGGEVVRAQDGHAVLLRRREALREYLDVARDEQDRDARFEQTVKTRAALLGFHSFYIARFYLAHDLNAVGIKIVKKTGQLKTGTIYIIFGDFELLKALRAVNYLKIKFVDQVSQAYAKFFKLHMGSPFRNICQAAEKLTFFRQSVFCSTELCAFARHLVSATNRLYRQTDTD